MTIKIGYAALLELDRLAELSLISEREHHERQPHFFPWTPSAQQTLERLASAFDSPDTNPESRTILVARNKGEVVGFLQFDLHSPDFESPASQIYILDISIDHSMRGGGVGRQLLDAVEALAKKSGIQRIDADVWEGNTASKGLFEALGYSPLKTNYTKLF